MAEFAGWLKYNAILNRLEGEKISFFHKMQIYENIIEWSEYLFGDENPDSRKHLLLGLNFVAIGYPFWLQYFKIRLQTLVTQKCMPFQFVIRV